MTSIVLAVLSAAWGTAKSIAHFSAGDAPNGAGAPTGFGAGAGAGSPGGSGGNTGGRNGGRNGGGNGGNNGGNNGGDDGGGDDGGGDDRGGDDSEEPRQWELDDDRVYDHEQGLPSEDESWLDTADRVLWDAVKNMLDIGPAIGVLEVTPAAHKALQEAQRRERKTHDYLGQDHAGVRHLGGGEQ